MDVFDQHPGQRQPTELETIPKLHYCDFVILKYSLEHFFFAVQVRNSKPNRNQEESNFGLKAKAENQVCEHTHVITKDLKIFQEYKYVIPKVEKIDEGKRKLSGGDRSKSMD